MISNESNDKPSPIRMIACRDGLGFITEVKVTRQDSSALLHLEEHGQANRTSNHSFFNLHPLPEAKG